MSLVSNLVINKAYPLQIITISITSTDITATHLGHRVHRPISRAQITSPRRYIGSSVALYTCWCRYSHMCPSNHSRALHDQLKHMCFVAVLSTNKSSRVTMWRGHWNRRSVFDVDFTHSHAWFIRIANCESFPPRTHKTLNTEEDYVLWRIVDAHILFRIYLSHRVIVCAAVHPPSALKCDYSWCQVGWIGIRNDTQRVLLLRTSQHIDFKLAFLSSQTAVVTTTWGATRLRRQRRSPVAIPRRVTLLKPDKQHAFNVLLNTPNSPNGHKSNAITFLGNAGLNGFVGYDVFQWRFSGAQSLW